MPRTVRILGATSTLVEYLRVDAHSKEDFEQEASKNGALLRQEMRRNRRAFTSPNLEANEDDYE